MASGLTEGTLVARLNRMNPVAAQVKLGQVLEDLITQHNNLLAALTAANISGLTLTGVSQVTPLSQR